MSEKKTAKMPVIPKDNITKIKVNGHYYSLVTQAYFSLASIVEPNKLKEIMAAIQNNNHESLTDPKDRAYYLQFRALIPLIQDIEKAFKEDGAIKEEEIEVPSED